MMYFLSVVLIGTIYPIFLDVISSQQISVGPPFYHKLIVPFLIPFLLAMAIGPNLNWIKSDLKNKFYLFLFLLISLVLSSLIIIYLKIDFLINTVLISSAFYLFFITTRDFIVHKFQNLAQNVSHFGFSLFILSVLFNNIFSSEIITNLKVGEILNKNTQLFFFKILQKKRSKILRQLLENLVLQTLKILNKF